MNLNRFYDESNEKWFGGELPKIPVQYWTKTKLRSVTFFHPHGLRRCPAHPCPGHYIGVDPQFKNTDVVIAMSLFHEMVHVKGLRDRRLLNHGPYFHAYMRELAIAGAFEPWW